LNFQKWLHIDWTYPFYHRARSELLENDKYTVIQSWKNEGLAGIIDMACEEALEKIVHWLTTEYPELFHKKGSEVENKLTGEIYDLADKQIKALEIATRLVSEDINILLPVRKLNNGGLALSSDGEVIDDFYLVGTASFFPAGGILKVGSTIQELHKPVPEWKEKLGKAVPNALKKIAFGVTPPGKPAPESERLAVFPQVEQLDKSLGELLHVLNSKDFFPQHRQHIKVEEMIFRWERQCFRRLERVNGVLFTVRTYVCYLDEMDPLEVRELARQVLKLPDSHAAYKQRDTWYPCLRDYCMTLGIDCETLEK
jgi:hypothetical protein